MHEADVAAKTCPLCKEKFYCRPPGGPRPKSNKDLECCSNECAREIDYINSMEKIKKSFYCGPEFRPTDDQIAWLINVADKMEQGVAYLDATSTVEDVGESSTST
jgi:hypothetical protein